jgi:beta-lactamase class C
VKIFYTLVFFIISLIIHSCKSDDVGPIKKNINNEVSIPIFTKEEIRLRDSLLPIINNSLDLNECPSVAICVLHHGKKLLVVLNGYKSIENKKDTIDINTMYRIGSLSKGFAGVLAAKLMNEGKFALFDPVSKYIPNFTLKSKPLKDTIRIWHILSHTTGLTEHAYTNLIEAGIGKEDLIKYLNKTYVRDSTGKRYAYQNAAFSLIEEVISSTTNLSYEDALYKYILHPLKMDNTTVGYDSMISANNKALPHQFLNSINGFYPTKINAEYYCVPSAGGINSNLADLIKWLSALLDDNNKIISKEDKTLVFQKRINTSWDDKYYNYWTDVDSSYYGLGWRILKINGSDIYFHGGQVNSYRSEIALNPKSKSGIIVMSNSPCSFTNDIVPIVMKTLDRIDI